MLTNKNMNQTKNIIVQRPGLLSRSKHSPTSPPPGHTEVNVLDDLESKVFVLYYIPKVECCERAIKLCQRFADEVDFRDVRHVSKQDRDASPWLKGAPTLVRLAQGRPVKISSGTECLQELSAYGEQYIDEDTLWDGSQSSSAIPPQCRSEAQQLAGAPLEKLTPAQLEAYMKLREQHSEEITRQQSQTPPEQIIPIVEKKSRNKN
jgi:hypothetical protein